ncbi:MAG: MBL fold metallo-hydrolase [Clostridia bacterium]|nr:MBL fold metallo-hydrolase [Clostridia bacterium]
MKKIGKLAVFIKAVALLCAVMACIFVLNSCTKKAEQGEGTTEAAVNALTLVSEGKADVKIVCNDGENVIVKDSAMELKSSLSELCGADISLESVSGDGIEILIGNSGDASKAAMDELVPNSYSITVSENKIIVVSNNMYLYSEAVDELLCAISVSDGVAAIAGDYSKKSDSYPVVALSEGDKTDYTIIYAAGDSTAMAQAKLLNNAFKYAGITVEVSSDAKGASGKEILIGDTNRKLSSQTKESFYKSVSFGHNDNGDLAVKGAVEVGITSVMDYIKAFADADCDIAIPHFLLKPKPEAGYGTAPKYTGVGTETVKYSYSAMKSYYVQVDGAKVSDYEDYLKKLKDEGYEEHYATEAQESRFATYTDGYSIVNVSYIEHKSISDSNKTVKYVNIAIDCTDNVALPAAEDDSKYVCEAQVSLINAHNTWLVRLEDGRFIVVDGGLTNSNNRNNADLIYKYMVEQNELDGNPVIAAWVITHPHSDHVQGFYDFTQRYKNKAELQMVISNMPNEADYNSAYSPQVYFGATESSPKAKFVVAHAGQRFAFAGLDLDILWTHENLYDSGYGDGNVASTVFSMTMAGGRVIITGDQQKAGCQIVNAIYREELKCDVIQICHHGYTGGDAGFYASTGAKVAVWPFNHEELTQNNAYGNNTANNVDVESFDMHLVMSKTEEIMTLREGMTKNDLKQFRKWE